MLLVLKGRLKVRNTTINSLVLQAPIQRRPLTVSDRANTVYMHMQYIYYTSIAFVEYWGQSTGTMGHHAGVRAPVM